MVHTYDKKLNRNEKPYPFCHAIFKIVGFCSKCMVLFVGQLYSICLQILVRLCNYVLCDDGLIGGSFIGIVNNVHYLK